MLFAFLDLNSLVILIWKCKQCTKMVDWQWLPVHRCKQNINSSEIVPCKNFTLVVVISNVEFSANFMPSPSCMKTESSMKARLPESLISFLTHMMKKINDYASLYCFIHFSEYRLPLV